MHIGFLNPQGNFDANDSHWTEHPDFGGQLVYVKNLALAMAKQGHHVDILTRQIIDPDWPEFAEKFDVYPDVSNLRIIRLPAGPKEFLRKELLWPHLVNDWVPNVVQFYREEGSFPDAITTHYADGGLCGVLIEADVGIPFTFTAHSLGALKMDKLHVTPENLAEMNEDFYFARRLVAERLSMNRSAVNITSTKQQERYRQYAHRAYWGAVDVKNDDRFATIPPGVDPDTFDAEARSPKEEEIYQLIETKLVRDIAEERRGMRAIVAASRLDPKKNLLGLVKAFAESPTLQEQANLILFTRGADNPLKEKVKDETAERKVLTPIREIVQEKNLWGKISTFPMPNQSALAAAYRFFAKRHSVFALISHHEPFGLGPLEAAVAGLPVVVTNNGGITESLCEGSEKYCILVDPEDPIEIGQGFERVLSDAQVWENLHHRSRQRVLDNYTWENTAREYLNLLEEIVSSDWKTRRGDLLPIHPYFRNPQSKDVSLEELRELYFGEDASNEKTR